MKIIARLLVLAIILNLFNIDISYAEVSTRVISQEETNPITINSLTPDKSSPQMQGRRIRWTCIASDQINVGYYFKVYKGDSIVASTNGFTPCYFFDWSPDEAGSDYRVSVTVKKNGTNNETTRYSSYYTINNVAISAITTDKQSPQAVGTKVRWYCESAGALDPMYYFKVYKGSTLVASSTAFSYNHYFDWTPQSTGSNYRVNVTVKDRDSGLQVNQYSDYYTVVDYLSLPADISEWVADEENGYIYAISNSSGYLYFINYNTFNIVKSVYLGLQPTDIDYEGGKIYVSLPNSKRIKVCDVPTKTIVSTLTTTSDAYRIAVDGNKLFYSEQDQHCNLYVYDMTSNMDNIINTIVSAYKPDLAVDRTNHILYIGESGSSITSAFAISTQDYSLVSKTNYVSGDRLSGKNRKTIYDDGYIYFAGHKLNAGDLTLVEGNYREDIYFEDEAIYKKGNLVFTSNAVYDIGKFVKIVDLPMTALNIFYSNNGYTYLLDSQRKIYRMKLNYDLDVTMHHSSNQYELVVDEPLTQWVSDDENGYIYAISREHNKLLFIKTSNLEVTKEIYIGSEPSDIELSNGMLYISLFGANKIVIVDAQTGEIANTLRTQGIPYRLAVDDNKLFYSEEDPIFGINVYDLMKNTDSKLNQAISVSRPDLTINRDNDILYIGDSGVTGGKAYAVNTADYSKVSQTSYANGYGFPSPDRNIVYDGDNLYYAKHILDPSNLSIIRGNLNETVIYAKGDYIFSNNKIFDKDAYLPVVEFNNAVDLATMIGDSEYFIYNNQSKTISRRFIKVSIESLASNVSSPQALGKTITFTTNATGTTSLLYKYKVNDGTQDVYVSDYSDDVTFAWTPAEVGTYTITAYVKDINSSNGYDAFATVQYVIKDALPITINSFTTNPDYSQVPIAIVTFKTIAVGGSELKYRYEIIEGTTRAFLNDYSNNNTYTLTLIKPGDYIINVYVKDKDSEAEYDATSQIHYTVKSPIPAVPSGLTVNSVGDSQVTLSWTANTEYDLALYIVEYKPITSVVWVGKVFDKAVTTGTITGLNNGVKYDFRIAAKDTEFNLSDYSGIVSAVPLDSIVPSTPKDLTVSSVNDNQVALRWTANTDADLGGYMLEYKLSTEAAWIEIPIGKSDTSYVISGLINGLTYDFRIKSKDTSNNWSDYSSVVNGTPIDKAPPAAPIGLAVTSTNDRQVVLNWTANTEIDLGGYQIEYKAGHETSWTAIQVDKAATTYTITGLINNTDYSFRIKAIDILNNSSGYSGVVYGVPADKAAPSIPEGFVVSSIEPNAIILRWNKNTEVDLYGYQLEYKLSTVSTWTEVPIVKTATSYLLTNLYYGQSYDFRLRAYDMHYNWSDYTEVIKGTPQDITAPSIPVALTINKAENQQVVISWLANNEPDLSGFQLEYKLNSAINWNTVSIPRTLKTYTVSGLTNGMEYNFRIKAGDNVGNWSEYSVVVSGTPIDKILPAAPVGLKVSSVNDGSAVLVWTANGETDLASYQLEYKLNTAASWNAIMVDKAAVTYTVTGLTNGASYSFRLKAIDTSNNSSTYSAIVNGAPIDKMPPAIPVGLVVSSENDKQIVLTWTANTETDLGAYQLEHKKSATSKWTVVAVPMSATSYTINGLTNGTLYNFRIKAKDTAGNFSEYSGVVDGTPTDKIPPRIPVGLQVKSVSDKQVVMSWAANREPDMNSYQLEYKLTAESEWNIITLAKKTSSYTVTALSNNMEYEFRIKAKDNYGNWSEYSEVINGTPLDKIAPAVPKGLKVASLDDGQANLVWTANKDADLAGYRLEYKLSTEAVWTEVLVDHETTTATISGLINGLSYNIRILAIDTSNNLSKYSKAVSAKPIDKIPPSAPEGLMISLSGDKQLVVSWSANREEDLSGYQLEYKLSTAKKWTIKAIPNTQNVYTITKLVNNSLYNFRIKAKDGSGNWSEYSVVIDGIPGEDIVPVQLQNSDLTQ